MGDSAGRWSHCSPRVESLAPFSGPSSSRLPDGFLTTENQPGMGREQKGGASQGSPLLLFSQTTDRDSGRPVPPLLRKRTVTACGSEALPPPRSRQVKPGERALRRTKGGISSADSPNSRSTPSIFPYLAAGSGPSSFSASLMSPSHLAGSLIPAWATFGPWAACIQ